MPVFAQFEFFGELNLVCPRQVLRSDVNGFRAVIGYREKLYLPDLVLLKVVSYDRISLFVVVNGLYLASYEVFRI